MASWCYKVATYDSNLRIALYISNIEKVECYENSIKLS